MILQSLTLTTHKELAVLSEVGNASQFDPARFSEDSADFLLSPDSMEFFILSASQLGQIEGFFRLDEAFLPCFWKLLSVAHPFC